MRLSKNLSIKVITIKSHLMMLHIIAVVAKKTENGWTYFDTGVFDAILTVKLVKIALG